MQTVTLKHKITSLKELQSFTLPQNWWSTNYSYDYFSEDNNSEIQLFKFEPPINDEIEFDEDIEKNIKSPSMKGWDYSHGDYYINERNFKDKANKQNSKSNFAKNYIYIGIAFAVFVTVLVLNVVTSM